MSQQRTDRDPASTEEDDASGFAHQPDESGVSLEDLSSAYAALLSQGDDPYQPIVDTHPGGQEVTAAAQDQAILDQLAQETDSGDDEACELSPRTLVEAMLFVGHPNNEPIAADRMASFMRGVRTEEVVEIIRDLNDAYRQDGCPYHIVAEGAGYRMTLHDEFRPLREKFYGRVKEARLSQAAIDVLAVVAYNQPITRERLDQLRDKDSGPLLAQLVRRRLLQLERRLEEPHVKYYRTTDRFLEVFGLASLDDLPRTQELERW
jgi:segregation and condensation protein B